MAVAYALAVLLVFICILHVSTNSHIFGSPISFSLELIHRDSPESPFHDPSSINFTRLHTDIHRSVAAQADRFHQVAPPYPPNYHLDPGDGFNISAEIIRHRFNYLLKIHIGTPPSTFYTVFDTGSQLSWVQCIPCEDCYKYEGQPFNSSNSLSYNKVPCHTETCNMLNHRPCDREDSPCEYHFTYADHSLAEGILSTETLWFDSPETTNKVPMQGFYFGCTHRTKGHFRSEAGGVAGFNGNKLSFARQLGPYTENMFSYCLPVHINDTARMYFGTAAVVSGPGAVSTPFHLSNPKSFYIINLESISIAGPTGNTFTINLERATSRRNNVEMIVDTGTLITSIPEDVMSDLTGKVVKIIGNRLRVDVPEHLANSFNLCFNWKKPINPKKMPKITFVFEGDAKVPLVDPFVLVMGGKISCLAIASNALNNLQVSVLGSNAQMDQHIGVEFNEHKITFRSHKCI